MAGVKHADEVCIDRSPKFFRAQLFDSLTEISDSRVVDQNVEAAEFLDAFRQHVLDVSLVADVAHAGVDRSKFRQPIGRSRERTFVASADKNTRAAFQKRFR